MCSSHKVVYQTKEDAIKAINGSLKQYAKKKKAYKCNRCPFWHITTIKRKLSTKAFILKKAIQKLNAIKS